jgi:hypothetical protein
MLIKKIARISLFSKMRRKEDIYKGRRRCVQPCGDKKKKKGKLKKMV